MLTPCVLCVVRCSIFHIAGPLFVEGVAAIGQQLVASSCVGHLNDDAALSALILAQSLYNVTGYSLVSGLASALETLCGQVNKLPGERGPLAVAVLTQLRDC